MNKHGYASQMPPLALLRYDLPTEVVAFSTQRQGGCSEGSYSSFNANPYCGDDPSHVARNRQLLCRKLGIADKALVLPHQVHETRTLAVTETFMRASDEEQTSLLEGVDAVMTNLRRVCVAVSTADCVPLLLYDFKKRVVAAVHSGWRGTLARIVCSTLGEMNKVYGSESRFVRAVIGPHISLSAFEVGDEVYEKFEKEHFPMHLIAERCGGRWHIDLSAANRYLLKECGLPEAGIEDAGVCSYTENERFFSARRQGIRSGRTLSGIMLV